MKLKIQKDLSEQVQYNNSDFPVYIRKGILSQYPNYAADCHWHDDIELIYVISGHMLYNINGKIVTLDEGNGIFVNSKQFHYGFSDDKSECIFICILLHPLLLNTSYYIEQKFLTPLLSENSIPFYVLHQNIDWEHHILDSILNIYENLNSPISELFSMENFFKIYGLLYTNLNIKKPNAQKNHRINSLKTMISFIQAHYKEKISLSEISSAGNVSKTSCCSFFQKYTNKTPVEYLNDFRLRKSIELLTSTDLTITEICYNVGFSGASYYTELFKKNFGCPPKEYRKKYSKIG